MEVTGCSRVEAILALEARGGDTNQACIDLVDPTKVRERPPFSSSVICL
jgi:hypothetical protein